MLINLWLPLSCCELICTQKSICMECECFLTAPTPPPPSGLVKQRMSILASCNNGPQSEVALWYMQLYWDVVAMPKVLTDTLVPRLVEVGLLSSASDVHQAVLNIYHKVTTCLFPTPIPPPPPPAHPASNPQSLQQNQM